jgi:hypothetical protein
VKAQRIVVSLALSLTVLGAGCASIVKGGGPQSVSIRSRPPDADVKVIDDKTGDTLSSGKTPLIVPLNRARGYFSGARYRIVIEKPGFDAREVMVDSSTNGWYIAGNLVFGGLIGWLIVDPATGAMWTLDPEDVAVELHATAPAPPQAPAATPDTTGKPVALMQLDDVAARHPELLAKIKRLPVAAQ